MSIIVAMHTRLSNKDQSLAEAREQIELQTKLIDLQAKLIALQQGKIEEHQRVIRELEQRLSDK